MKKDKQAWTGTVPFFVFIVSMIFILWFFFFGLSFWIVSDFLPLWVSILSSVYFAFGLYALFLNIPIPRRRKNPVRDLDGANKIAE